MLTVMPILKGFVIGAGLIIPIGAQNSYVLSQSIKRNHHLVAATICIVCDFILMAVGVYGGGALLASNSALALIITWAGIVFLSVYGALFFKSCYQGGKGDMLKKVKPSTRKVVVFTTLAVTLLNPHVYLDTVVIIGSISGQFDDSQKSAFLVGIMLASLVWFYSLSLAAAKMSPWLSQEKVQRVINFLVAVLMWSIAWSLFNSL
ncbi:LysE/ArgO family amino acid transporter [Thalassomonas sp. M1454]|uniref:LysE/ArgO family amino acid transporter n=1 Tax=Thalassomonas sp. M1454 TaxID=2594477 RepID=UPI00117DBC90|nr:LysE/ArgO family amino acid transporter [Thalassomonas sp. M1454]TRX54482.1 amino acid transporter [Thalassomonas sp. M1454]